MSIPRPEVGATTSAISTVSPVHALILTFNEEIHIRRCIESVAPYCTSILVVDSYSTDATRAIAESLGAETITRPFINHAAQLNVGITHLARRPGWILRIDADEVLEPPPGRRPLVPDAETAAGLLVRRRIFFLGQRIRFGGIEPNWQMRLWRNGSGHCEQRWMDEHVIINGAVARSAIEISDINLNPVGWWTQKHNGYASREAIELLDRKFHLLTTKGEAAGTLHRRARLKRYIKNRVYLCLPSALRAFFYFSYRYLLRLGFLDGGAGYYFHFLQAYWYRTLVDCKAEEIERYRRQHDTSWIAAIEAITGIVVEP